jgi:hypothetical protein
MAKVLKRIELRVQPWVYEGVEKVSEAIEESHNKYISSLIEDDLAKHGIKKPKKTLKTEQE